MNRTEFAQSEVLRYFTAERAGSLLFIFAGISAIIVSIFLFRISPTYRGMVYPLVSIALIQLIVGATVFMRTNKQVISLIQQLNLEPTVFQASEISRMETVMANFRRYKIIEIMLLASGIFLTFALQRRSFLFGVGIGLIIQSAITLILDIFAERRGELYLNFIRSF